MDKQQLRKILEKHKLWLQNNPNGVRANLSGANLSRANLSGANLQKVYDKFFKIVPEGCLIVWKALADNVIAKLEIPMKAKRVNFIASRKCRAEYAKVLQIEKLTGEKIKSYRGKYKEDFFYTVGKIVRPDKFDDSPMNECSNGIHFFLTKEEAIEWTKS